MNAKGKKLCYALAALVAVIIIAVGAYAIYTRTAGGDTFGNPQPYTYGDYLISRAAQGGPRHGDRARDGHRGHDHGVGGSRVDFDYGHGYFAADGVGEKMASCEGMMSTGHWEQPGTYQHTPATWGLPAGGVLQNYSGYSKEPMMSTAHWDHERSFGSGADTLAAYSYSGYSEEVPTPGWA